MFWRSVIVARTMSVVPCAVLIVPIASTSHAMIAVPSATCIARIWVWILAMGTDCLHLNVFAYMCLETLTSLDGVKHAFLHFRIPVAQASKLGKTLVTFLGDGCASKLHSPGCSTTTIMKLLVVIISR